MSTERFPLEEGETAALLLLVPFGVAVPMAFGPSGVVLTLDLSSPQDCLVGETLVGHRALNPRRIPSRLSLTMPMPT